MKGAITLCLTFITASIVQSADVTYMEGAIRDHFSNTRHHLPQFVAYKHQARNFIRDEFTRFGLEVTSHTFNETVNGEEFVFQTVIGILKGQRFGSVDDEIVGLGAHYDSVPTTKGVDDNGSGLAALLEVARTLTNANKNGMTRLNTLLFVSFDLEEHFLTGSRRFVGGWLPAWINSSYSGTPRPRGIFVLDTIMEYNRTAGSQTFPPGADALFQQLFPDTFASISSDGKRGDFLLMIYRKPTNDSILASFFNNSWSSARRDMYEIEPFALPFNDFSSLSQQEQYLYSPFMRSDHANFWGVHIPAIFLTDSANFRGDMVKCYHEQCDDLDTMLTDDNLEFLGKTTDALTDAIGRLSGPSGPTGAASTSEGHFAWIVTLSVIMICVYKLMSA